MINSDEQAHMFALLRTLHGVVKHKPTNRLTITTVLRDLLLRTTEYSVHEDEMLFRAGHPRYLNYKNNNKYIVELVRSLIGQHRYGLVNLEAKTDALIQQWSLFHLVEDEKMLVQYLSELF
jgi:hemerythrin